MACGESFDFFFTESSGDAHYHSYSDQWSWARVGNCSCAEDFEKALVPFACCPMRDGLDDMMAFSLKNYPSHPEFPSTGNALLAMKCE